VQLCYAHCSIHISAPFRQHNFKILKVAIPWIQLHNTLLTQKHVCFKLLYSFRWQNIRWLSLQLYIQHAANKCSTTLHVMTSDQPAVINITTDQEELVWRQPEDTEAEVRINFGISAD